MAARDDLAGIIGCSLGVAALAAAAAAAFAAWESNRVVSEALEIRSMGAADGYGGWRHARVFLESSGASVRDAAAVLELLGVARSRAGDAVGALEPLIGALRRRPVSPFTWADVVEAKYESGHVDGQFRTALRNAAWLGAGEPEVQRTVLSYGLATWDEVDDETRRAVDRVAARAVAADPETALQVARQRGKLAIACAHLRREAHVSTDLLRLCQKDEGLK